MCMCVCVYTYTDGLDAWLFSSLARKPQYGVINTEFREQRVRSTGTEYFWDSEAVTDTTSWQSRVFDRVSRCC